MAPLVEFKARQARCSRQGLAIAYIIIWMLWTRATH